MDLDHTYLILNIQTILNVDKLYQVENLKINLKGQARSINNEMENFKLRWEQLKPKDSEIARNPEKFDQAIQYISQMRTEWDDLSGRMVTLV